jgi:site-specific recombinase
MRVHGTTSELTQQLLGAGQMLARLRTLSQLVAPRNADERFSRGLRLFQKLVEEQNRETSLRDLWRRSTNMLALQVTEQAGRTGEHYVAQTRAEWRAMFGAAFGAGLIVGLMALLKIGITALHLPPLWHALGVSLNYAIGFVVVHLLHFTIATKQPAMTAALIAATVRTDRRGNRSIGRLASLVVAIVRTQLVAIAGNVLAAFPTAVALYYAVAWLLGPGWIGTEKAAHLLHDQHPFASLALPHAAIAGICLFLAGVVAGYYDNLGALTRVPERIRRAPWLAWLAPAARARVAGYVERNLGALAGNVVFGFLLGMTGFVGLLLGLPLDIRHVTFSAANLAYGAAASHWALPWQELALLCLGVVLIGLVNLGVSFTLALSTALRANGIRLTAQRRLWELLKRRFLRAPASFFWPPAR